MIISLTVVRWAAFYADGAIVTSAQSTWEALSPLDVVIAVWWDENDTRHLECGADSLVNTGASIVSVNLPTPAFESISNSEAAAGRLKYGVYMDADAWAQLRQVADDYRTPPG